MPTARAVLAASVANKEVFFIGGGSAALGALDTSTVESYDPVTNTWTHWADMPTPRGTLTAATVNGLIYAIGGGFNIGQVATVEVYDPLLNIWSERTDMSAARWGVTSGVIGRKIYVLGGSTELGVGHNSLSTNEVYTAESPGINAGHSGAWFNPDTSGQGQFIDVVPEEQFMFISWFTFGDETASGQRWLTAQGGIEGSIAEIDVFETTGGSFDDPEPVNTTKVGTMSLDFTDCSNAQLTYSLPADPAEGDIAITRVISGSQALCEELVGAD